MTDTLSVLLPTADETALLAACLHTGVPARDAWSSWRAGRGVSEKTLCHDLANARTLLPLLARSVRRNDLDVGPEVLSYLRATVLREELRAGRYRQIAAEALAALDPAGVTAFVVRGAALAATVYDAWSDRHCHDLDLLVTPRDVASTVHTLMRVGCVPVHSRPDPQSCALLVHSSGLQLGLHTRPFGVRYYDVAAEEFTRNARSIMIDGVEARTPSREATLCHVLGHATYSRSRRNLRWVADAWHILAADGGVDWGDVLVRLDAYRLTLPVSVLLHYLAEFGMAVAPEVVIALRQRAVTAERAAEEVALGGAHAGPRGDLGSLWRSTSSWRGRARFARWVVAPSATYMRSAFPLPASWLVPLCYVYRPARFIARRLVRRTAFSAERGEDALLTPRTQRTQR